MRLLPTSAGVSNIRIRTALTDLLEYDEAALPVPAARRASAWSTSRSGPHLHSHDFPGMSIRATTRAATRVDGPLYAIDDQPDPQPQEDSHRQPT